MSIPQQVIGLAARPEDGRRAECQDTEEAQEQPKFGPLDTQDDAGSHCSRHNCQATVAAQPTSQQEGADQGTYSQGHAVENIPTQKHLEEVKCWYQEDQAK